MTKKREDLLLSQDAERLQDYKQLHLEISSIHHYCTYLTLRRNTIMVTLRYYSDVTKKVYTTKEEGMLDELTLSSSEIRRDRNEEELKNVRLEYLKDLERLRNKYTEQFSAILNKSR